MLIRLTFAVLVSFSFSQAALATSGFKREIPVVIKNKVVHLLNELCVEKKYCTQNGIKIYIHEPYCFEVYKPSFFWPFYQTVMSCHFGAAAQAKDVDIRPTVTDTVEVPTVEDLLDITNNYETLNPKVEESFINILDEALYRVQ